MQAIDDAVLLWLARLGQTIPGLETIARAVTELGGYRFLVPLSVVAAVWLYFGDHARRAVALLLVIFGGRLVVEIAKKIIDRPRPEFLAHQVEVHSLSFPSGHAGNSMIVFLTVALIIGPLITRRRWPLVCALVCTLLIGLTRPILAVHWLTDVLAGWSLGVAWTLSVVWLLDGWMKGQPVKRTGHPEHFSG